MLQTQRNKLESLFTLVVAASANNKSSDDDCDQALSLGTGSSDQKDIADMTKDWIKK